MRSFAGILIAVLSPIASMVACSESPPVEPNGKSEEVKVSSVTINPTTLTLAAGGSETLTANVSPSNAANKSVDWSSDNVAVARVDQNGKVSAVKVGTALITAETDDGGHVATCSVTVKAGTVAVSAIRLNKTELTMDAEGEITLKATVTPSNATDKTVKWSSSNNSRVTVDANGKVTAIAIGSAVITCTAAGGNEEAACQIIVTTPDPDNLLRSTFIPDPVFLDYCREQMAAWDTNDDGKLYKAEAAAVKSIDVANIYGNAISSLRGIEYFTGITILNCSLNNLTSLDVSANTRLVELYCNSNKRLSSLEISFSTLRILNCSACAFTALDLSTCTRLEDLSCSYNELASLDISTCTSLVTMDVTGNNLRNLNLSKNRKLNGLLCDSNDLETLDVSACTALTTLECQNNSIAQLKLDNNAELVSLLCDMNMLTELDLTKNDALEHLVCNGNLIASIGIDESNTRLSIIRSSNNRLSTGALNAAFEALPYSGDVMTIGGNPGTSTCDVSIAEKKNWRVYVE